MKIWAILDDLLHCMSAICEWNEGMTWRTRYVFEPLKNFQVLDEVLDDFLEDSLRRRSECWFVLLTDLSSKDFRRLCFIHGEWRSLLVPWFFSSSLHWRLLRKLYIFEWSRRYLLTFLSLTSISVLKSFICAFHKMCSSFLY